ncbi:MAG: aspartate/tyrosine/aromatic aminotransferase [Woeseia sp.]|nr:aspartate/tyrosine/aromatic aminotransferase [Woeseia sp.]MBT8097863.1 aspartate/tyrosine/aromatic aminotransferase [Woeseia sp.]NNE60281.1 aspartate/tyrosine/aromatic aminotransferase [Woeseia sp.]NNL54305.1 aspartate/tyrosine/aromatic aminotransferase [Woeseia sp.]
MFSTLEALPSDAILKLIAEHASDARSEKVDLGVGVYRTEQGETPVLASVKKAERQILETQTSKTYLGSGGDPEFNLLSQQLTFGDDVAAERITTLQTPGGSGGLRVAAGLVLRARRDATVWHSNPTWANHVPLLGGAGLNLKPYPYYDYESRSLVFDQMMDRVNAIPEGDLVLLHGCCHNPTGMDLSQSQWKELAERIAARKLLPFVDMAYQGFANGIKEDVYPIHLLAGMVPEMIVVTSCSKNFGLYRDRVGSLSFVCSNAETAATVRSQAHNLVRTMYSMPPDHGAAIVREILGNPSLRAEWVAEVDGMRARLKNMRVSLVAALRREAPDHDFSHVEQANGMFCFLGISEPQVERLKKDCGVYMVNSSRINVAGITPGNVDYLAKSIALVL